MKKKHIVERTFEEFKGHFDVKDYANLQRFGIKIYQRTLAEAEQSFDEERQKIIGLWRKVCKKLMKQKEVRNGNI